jgi:hypothetical protein
MPESAEDESDEWMKYNEKGDIFGFAKLLQATGMAKKLHKSEMQSYC